MQILVRHQNFPRRELLEDTRFLFQRGGHEMQQIIREGNNFADTSAKLGTDQSVRHVELEDPPAAITGMLMADLIHWLFVDIPNTSSKEPLFNFFNFQTSW
ncbi:hypothetical protein RHGRI_019410 [Rhododendron griersonianum]|uniref:Uncharacterized protein n=1 Tax=Rhododendron griersonianum TaxID=479676 RepID=A0AAV6JGZ1_9ERIC|nr:hypothetical protein RHGRI_019410 [Rhododendron griersonianum]